MKVVVIGGTGLIGMRLVGRLRTRRHEVVAAAPSRGVDTVTGVGLAEAVRGATVVVDVSNAPAFEEEAVRTFFETSGRNIVGAARDAGIRHLAMLSVVGTDRLQGSGYFRAKAAQERLYAASGLPCTIVRSTQFFEFARAIADAATEGATVRLPAARVQPIAADDVAELLAEVVVGTSAGGSTEIAGPEVMRLDEFARRYLHSVGDARAVVRDDDATYFGAHLDADSLAPASQARHGRVRFADWLAASRH